MAFVGEVEIIVVDLAFGQVGGPLVGATLVDLGEKIVLQVTTFFEVARVFEKCFGVRMESIENFSLCCVPCLIEEIHRLRRLRDNAAEGAESR